MYVDSKKSSWWSEELKIKSNKEKWKVYSGNRINKSYNKYKEQGNKINGIAKCAKSGCCGSIIFM